MLERRSALAAAKPYRSSRLQMGEVRGFTLTQISGLSQDFEARIAPAVGEIPARAGKAVDSNGRTLMRVGPAQFWIIAPETDDLAMSLAGLCAVTPLSHSRTRIFLEGAPVRDLLAKGIPLDFHPGRFTPGMFALTGLHHTPVLVHCVSETRFELHALRSFALNVWEWLSDAALELADRNPT